MFDKGMDLKKRIGTIVDLIDCEQKKKVKMFYIKK
jgi:hypothetical protein